ncbi:peptide MFS transporter [Sphingopyxis sp.]|uniref:peptide MFS transporter n=1 Tax=Sphingopyxis sp. TaxID=1908224 RepID=UPI002EDA7B6B
MTRSRAPVAGEAGDWFGQPRGLTVLFLTEMWSQFSFFGMRALLVLYATKHLKFAQADASWIYGLYAAAVYITPVFGGLVSDRWLGRRNAVMIGGLIMALGHIFMAFENLFLVALATIALGNGLFLPGLPAQIDSLYPADDPRRKSAYSIYYMGINVGAFAAPLVIGTVGELYGFHRGFGIAAVGMFIGMAVYAVGGRYLPRERARGVVAASALPTAGPPRRSLGSQLALLAGIAAVIVIFRGAYEQIGNTMTLWADSEVDRSAGGGLVIPVTWFLALNSLIVISLSPWLVRRWNRRIEAGRELSTMSKMAIGAALVGLSFFLLSAVAGSSGAAQVSWVWLVLFMALLTVGELYILPVGVGLFARLAPANLAATTIALWYSAGFFGNLFAGWIGTLWQPLGTEAFFAVAGAIGVTSALLLKLFDRTVRLREDETAHPVGAGTGAAISEGKSA